MLALILILLFSYVPIMLSQQPAKTPKILIGAAISLSGKYEVEGKAVRDGYKMWAEWTNRAGGIQVGNTRMKVEIIYIDDQSNPDILASIYQNTFIPKVNFIFGPYSSELCRRAQDIAEKNKIILIQANGGADSLFKPTNKYSFGLQTTTKNEIQSTLELLKNKKAKTIVIAYEDEIYAKNLVEGIKHWAPICNMEIVRSAMYPHLDESAQNDPVKQTAAKKKIEEIIGEFNKLHPDVFIGCGHFYDALRYVDVSKKLDFLPQAFVVTVGATDPRFVELLKADANNIICPTQWDVSMIYKDTNFGSAQDYAVRFKAIIGSTEPPSYHAAESSATGLVLQIAIQQAGSLDTEKVLEKLRNLDITTFYGPIKFDNTGRNIAKPMGIMQIQNGKPVLVGPPSVLSKEGFELIYPKPKWTIGSGAQ